MNIKRIIILLIIMFPLMGTLMLFQFVSPVEGASATIQLAGPDSSSVVVTIFHAEPDPRFTYEYEIYICIPVDCLEQKYTIVPATNPDTFQIARDSAARQWQAVVIWRRLNDGAESSYGTTFINPAIELPTLPGIDSMGVYILTQHWSNDTTTSHHDPSCVGCGQNIRLLLYRVTVLPRDGPWYELWIDGEKVSTLEHMLRDYGRATLLEPCPDPGWKCAGVPWQPSSWCRRTEACDSECYWCDSLGEWVSPYEDYTTELRLVDIDGTILKRRWDYWNAIA